RKEHAVRSEARGNAIRENGSEVSRAQGYTQTNPLYIFFMSCPPSPAITNEPTLRIPYATVLPRQDQTNPLYKYSPRRRCSAPTRADENGGLDRFEMLEVDPLRIKRPLFSVGALRSPLLLWSGRIYWNQ